MATLRIRRVARARHPGDDPCHCSDLAQRGRGGVGRSRSAVGRRQLHGRPYLPGQGSLQRLKDDHAAALAAPAGRRRAPGGAARHRRDPAFERALDYVPGVNKQNDFGAQNLALYSVRGFATQDIFFNGFNIARGYNGSPDTQNVQSIEVLKGPSGALYGRSDPGGTVNILTKQPVALPFVEMGTLFGSFGTARTTVDAGGPLNEEGTVLYRFNGALARQDSFRDFVDGDRVLAAPVVSWLISPDTKLTSRRSTSATGRPSTVAPSQ